MLPFVDTHIAFPDATRAFVALHEKGSRFDMHTVDLRAGELRQRPDAERSIMQRVPTLPRP